MQAYNFHNSSTLNNTHYLDNGNIPSTIDQAITQNILTSNVRGHNSISPHYVPITFTYNAYLPETRYPNKITKTTNWAKFGQKNSYKNSHKHLNLNNYRPKDRTTETNRHINPLLKQDYTNHKNTKKKLEISQNVIELIRTNKQT